MYIILHWQSENDNYFTAIKNKDDSIRLFETLKEADKFANHHSSSDDLRVINIEGVKE